MPETEVNARCDGVVVPNGTEQIPSSRRSLSSVDKTYEYSTSASLVQRMPENRESRDDAKGGKHARCKMPALPVAASQAAGKSRLKP